MRVWCLLSSVQGSGFRGQGLGFRVQGSGFRVQGVGLRPLRSRNGTSGGGPRPPTGQGFGVWGLGYLRLIDFCITQL